MADRNVTTSIFGPGPLVGLGRDESLYVAPGIIVRAISGNAIVTSEPGGGTTSDIQGSVVAVNGMGFKGAGAGHRIEVGVTGSIQASFYGISIDGDGAHIINRGAIAGYHGIVIDGGNATIENSGTIRGTATYAAAILVTGSPGQTNTIINRGWIDGGPTSLAFDAFTDANTVFTNMGTIVGEVELDDGHDLFDGRSGTMLSGSIFGDSGNDTLLGGASNETIWGERDNDLIEGGLGDDRLTGGDGIDTLQFSGTTAATVDLRIQGEGTSQNTGYGLDTISGFENITGGAGNDRFTGDAATNVLDGGAGGSDTVAFTTAATVNLTASGPQNTGSGLDILISIENLVGSEAGDLFTGNAFANELFGQGGADTQLGGGGDDRLYGGLDRDQLWGNVGKDRLSGEAGNDRLYGGVNNDVLSGGAGRDVFVFDTNPNKKTNKDKITDFRVKDDSLWLDNAIFKKLGGGTVSNPKALNKEFFITGTKAEERDDYLIYNRKTGVLSYDADGSGSEAVVEIATLSKNLKFTHKDFFVI